MNQTSVAIWLYGSNARGDADPKSDLDILAISNRPVTAEEVAQIVRVDPAGMSISRYSWLEVEGMASYGSLFLQHIRREGKCLYEGPGMAGRLRTLLDSLGPYNRALIDVNSFRLTVRDVRRSLSEGGSLPFELSVLGTVARHAAILGCYVSGWPTFGRIEPVRRLVALWDLTPQTLSLFVRLYDSRLFADQRSGAPTGISVDEAYEWCDRLDVILNELEVRVHGYETKLQETHSVSEGVGTLS